MDREVLKVIELRESRLGGFFVSGFIGCRCFILEKLIFVNVWICKIV